MCIWYDMSCVAFESFHEQWALLCREKRSLNSQHQTLYSPSLLRLTRVTLERREFVCTVRCYVVRSITFRHSELYIYTNIMFSLIHTPASQTKCVQEERESTMSMLRRVIVGERARVENSFHMWLSLKILNKKQQYK